MTLKQYRHAYAYSAAKDKVEALRRVIGAERALAARTAPVYYAAQDVKTSLFDTGEYHAFIEAEDILDLPDEEVLSMAPPMRRMNTK